MTSLDLFSVPTSAADRVDLLARLRAVTDLLGGFEKDVRAELKADLLDTMETVGGKFTLRAGSGNAYVSGGEKYGDPKPRVCDVDAFGAWAEAVDEGLARRVKRVEVTDQDAAAGALEALRDPDPGMDLAEAAQALQDALKVVDEWVIAKPACDQLLSRGLVTVAGDVLVDTSTGERVPGTEVTYSSESLTVTPDKDTVGRYRGELRGVLGLPGGVA